MNTPPKNDCRFVLNCFAIALMISMFCSVAKATPYASGVTESGGTVNFILNESADDVTVVFSGPASTNVMGPLAAGPQSFSKVGTAYQIRVTKATPLAWTQYSSNSNPFNNYFSPGGIAVNRNPTNLALFGRIYISENIGGTTAVLLRDVQEGIYILNADQSDALGRDTTASTAGITFEPGNTAASGQKSPWKIEIGADNNLYIADFTTNYGTIYQTDPDVNTSVVVLDGIGSTVNPTVHTSCNGSPIVKGSTALGNLQVWAIDGQWSGGRNRLLRWDINGAALPYNSPPSAQLGSAGNSSVNDVQSDLDIAPDGKFFLCQNRSAGTPNVYNSTQVNLRVYDTNGTSVLWDSLSNSITAGLGTDFLVNARSIAVSPDGKKMAVGRTDTRVWIVGLTNGIPDITQTNLLQINTGTTTSTANRREVAFDAAGNLYAGDNSFEILHILSPGGTKTAVTGSGGTFHIESPVSEVTVTAPDNSASETGDTGLFTFSRTGDLSSALTVSYTLSGTAANGSDYALPGSITFASSAATTNISLTASNDVAVELTETVIIAISNSPNYLVGSPNVATASILDNETPELSITALQPTVAESGTTAAFQITRRGDLSINLPTINLTYSGTASGAGVDYTGPASVSIAPSAVTQTVSVDVTTDSDNEPNETIIISLASGSGYTIGAPNSASTLILNDDAPLPPGTLFTENFELDVSPLWNINKANNPNGNLANFSFDYSTVGIPAAPNSSGTTKGLKLQANLTGGTFGGLSVSPKNKTFTGDYVMSFDMWINFHGPLQVGGSGSTQVTGAGIGTVGTTAQWAASTQDSVHFGTTGDGGSSVDYRAYSSAAATGYLPASGVFAAGSSAAPDSRDNADPHYSSFGGLSAPAAQLALYPQQTGTTTNGAVGMKWCSVLITVTNNTAIYSIDGLTIATVDLATVVLGGSDILLNYYDINATSSADTNAPALHFGLIDNLKVTIPSAPTIQITSIQVNGGNVVINFTDPSSETTAAFKLQNSSNVVGPYADDNSALFSGSSGAFSVTTAVNGAAQFYQIKRNP